MVVRNTKKVYSQFDKIIRVLKRPSKKGFKYSFFYKLKEKEYLILSFFLDEDPQNSLTLILIIQT